MILLDDAIVLSPGGRQGARSTIFGRVVGSGGGVPPIPQITTLGYVLDGDSITDGYGVTPSYPTQLGAITGLPFTNLGVSGRTLATMDSTFASRDVAAQFNASGRNTLVILGGINDIMNTGGITLSALQASMTSYLGKAKAAGFKVLVGVLPPVAGFTTERETLRTGFNDWIKANAATLADGFIDFPAVPDLGDPSNLYFYLDGLHPSKRGYARIAEAVRVATGVALVEDIDPTAFPFASVSGAAQSTVTTSAEIEIEGITGPAPISITGGSYSINGAAFTTADGTILPYDKLRARVTSAAAADTAAGTTITIGGVSSSFIVTTEASGPAPTNFVTNGTFDTDLAGWTFYAFTSDYSANNLSAARGTRTAEARMRITAASNAIYPQGITTLAGLTIGQVYTVSIEQTAFTQFGYAMGVYNTGGSAPGGVRVEASNVLDIGVRTFSFTATQTTHYLRIQAGAETSGAYNEFDNISVTAAAAIAPTPVVAGSTSAIANPQSTTGSVAAVAGTQAGDLLIAAIALGVNNTGIVTPEGWTRVLNVPSTSPPTSDGAVYAKIATGSEPSTYNFTWTSSTRYIISLTRITGAVLPPHASAAFVAGASSPTATAPEIATTGANALLLDFVVLGTGLRTVTMAAGMTEVYQGTNNNSTTDRCTLAVARREVASPATTAARAYGISPDTTWGAATLAIRGS